MSLAWLPIRYRDFYDIPRAVIVEWNGQTYLFDCLFDPSLDEYQDIYSVYRVPFDLLANLDDGSWTDLGHRCEFVASVAVRCVEFDQTRRSAMNSRVFSCSAFRE